MPSGNPLKNKAFSAMGGILWNELVTVAGKTGRDRSASPCGSWLRLDL